MLEISLAAETLFKIAGFPVTNSLLVTWIVMVILIVFSFLTTRKLTNKPSKLQTVLEMVIGGLHGFFTSLLGHHIDTLFPLIASLFLFIITSNYFGLLPGVGTIGIYEPIEANATSPSHINTDQKSTPESKETTSSSIPVNQAGHLTAVENTLSPETASTGESNELDTNDNLVENNAENETAEKKFVPLFRAPTADLNLTLALGIIAFVMIQYYGFKVSGLSYGKKFINITNPIYAFVGFLEIISDISKIISFAFRLFGNIFAGEVLLSVIAYIGATFIKIPLLLPIPFLALEIFVGFVQALVFAMLVSVFINIAASHSEHH